MIEGRFRDGLPRITLDLPTKNGGEQIVTFIVDTGFNGDLTLPESLARALPEAIRGEQSVTFAGGFGRRCFCYEIELADAEGEPRMVEVLIMDGNPLMGNNYLRNQLLTVELTEGGDVLAEPL